MTARFIIGDSLTVLRTLPDASVDLVLTSPPFWKLRSYLPADHASKHREMGSEATPADFMDALLDVVEALARVLAPHGSMVIELGDSYVGSGGSGGDYTDTGWRAGQEKFGGSSSRARTSASRWSIAQATWLAGVIDTEGYIGARRQESHRKSPNFQATVRVTMMDRQVCDRCVQITGVGAVVQDGRNAYSWGVNAQQARYVLTHIWPHLLIKQRQAKAAIELQRHIEARRRRGKHEEVSQADIDYRQQIVEYVQGLNGRGERRGVYVPTWEPPMPPRMVHQELGVCDGLPMDKSLALIPEAFRIALAYGRNPFNGRETPPWRVRNVVRHFRPNPPVGALGDKFRPATSDWVVACKSGTRFFDLDAVRGPGSDNTHARTARGVESRLSTGKTADDERRGGNFSTLDTLHETNGAPPLDWWDDDDLEWKDAAGFVQPTSGFKGSHYAVFSPRVVKRLIVPMCPERVCRTCGEPSRRIVGDAEYRDSVTGKVSAGLTWSSGIAEGLGASTHKQDGSKIRVAPTTGWTDCGHDDYRRGVVLDPFAGSGTTLQVANGHGFDAIGIDLDARNADLARERVGMWLTVETT